MRLPRTELLSRGGVRQHRLRVLSVADSGSAAAAGAAAGEEHFYMIGDNPPPYTRRI